MIWIDFIHTHTHTHTLLGLVIELIKKMLEKYPWKQYDGYRKANGP